MSSPLCFCILLTICHQIHAFNHASISVSHVCRSKKHNSCFSTQSKGEKKFDRNEVGVVANQRSFVNNRVRLFGNEISVDEVSRVDCNDDCNNSANSISDVNNNEIKSQKVQQRKRPSTTLWVACSSTIEVTRAIEMHVCPGDNVVELGSQLRESSSALCESIGSHGRSLLVDVKRNYPKNLSQGRTSSMRLDGDDENFYSDRSVFHELKSFDAWRQTLFFPTFQDSENYKPFQPYQILVADVGTVAGNDLDLTCLSLVREFLALNQPKNGDSQQRKQNPCRTVILKSSSLSQLARRLIHAQRLISGTVDIQKENKQLKSENKKNKRKIIATVGVEEYRQTIPYVVQPGDSVLEVGCHFGTTTTMLNLAAKGDNHNDTGFCIGVDIGPRIIKSAKIKNPNVPFSVADAWHTAELLKLKQNHPMLLNSDKNNVKFGYDVVYVDIGGLSGSEGLLEAVSLISSLGNSLEPRCIVIKSLCMKRLASRLKPFSAIWKSKKKTLMSDENM